MAELRGEENHLKRDLESGKRQVQFLDLKEFSKNGENNILELSKSRNNNNNNGEIIRNSFNNRNSSNNRSSFLENLDISVSHFNEKDPKRFLILYET
jgi:hypothetical protein